jgi:hypothetical protein
LITPPPDAFTVRVKAPGAAVEPADRVSVLVPAPGAAMLTGAKAAVTPVGTPVMDNPTAELKPLPRVVVNVTGIDPPGATLALVALDESVNVPKTARLRVWVLVTPAPAAVTANVKVPAAAVEPADRVSVLLPAPGEAMLVGENFAVTPAGTPLIDRATAALNPLTLAVVNVMGIDPPGATLALVALDESVNVPKTARLSVWVLVTPPPVAVTVNVEVPAAAVEPAARVSLLLPLPGARRCRRARRLP